MQVYYVPSVVLSYVRQGKDSLPWCRCHRITRTLHRRAPGLIIQTSPYHFVLGLLLLKI